MTISSRNSIAALMMGLMGASMAGSPDPDVHVITDHRRPRRDDGPQAYNGPEGLPSCLVSPPAPDEWVAQRRAERAAKKRAEFLKRQPKP